MTSDGVYPPSIVAGAVFADRYVLTERIAGGGMGEVWRAEDTVLHRGVAVKFLREEFADDELFRERLRREARAAGSISHPGVVPVFDFGEFTRENGAHLAFIVMEYIDGTSLASILKPGPISLPRTLEIIEQTALALQAAHDAGVVHRDVKPANILISSGGEVKLTDFGISHAADAMPITRTGVLIGTASYLSPEQAGGQQATKASDIYSLGVVAYACLTGEAPFSDGNDISVALSHIRDQPGDLPHDVPAGPRDLVMAMLEKEPGRRPASAAAVAISARAGLPLAQSLDLPAPATGDDGGDRTRVDLSPVAPPVRSGLRVRTVGIVVALLLIVAVVVVWNRSTGQTVPELVGVQQAVATTRLNDAGLRFSVSSVDVAGKKAGVVIKQSIPAGASVDDGSTVTITVASGKVDVPAGLKGSTYAAAVASLQTAGLKALKSSAVSSQPVGSVIAVSPVGRVVSGSTITLTVAAAPAPAPVAAKTTKGKGNDKPKGKKGG